MELEPTATIAQLEAALELADGVAPGSYRMLLALDSTTPQPFEIFSGDDHSLAHYGITEAATFFLINRSRVAAVPSALASSCPGAS